MKRTNSFRKNQSYESLVDEVNRLLPSIPDDSPLAPEGPTTFIVGVPRSGTTLLYQLLSQTGTFGYPTNFVARYVANPGFGALAQRLFQPMAPPRSSELKSRLGQTDGWNSPHEFGYFWERWFPFDDHHEPIAEALDAIDGDELLRTLAYFERCSEAPLLFKNTILSFVLPSLAELIPDARFIEIVREPGHVAMSLLGAREKMYGDPSAWFSTRPANWQSLMELDPLHQVAGQIAAIESSHAQLRTNSEVQWKRIEYAELCESPRAKISECLDWLGLDGQIDEIPERLSASSPPHTPELHRFASIWADLHEV
jgi:hypothetical protein